MPFTFSHPALVLPLGKLTRHWLSLTGLVAGSVAPDFEYFIWMHRGSAHHLNGLLTFNLPLGIAIAFLFHDVLKTTLIDNFPRSLRARLIAYRDFNWNHYFVKRWFPVAISVLVGALSHLLWDSITHRPQTRPFFTDQMEWLSTDVVIFGNHIFLYRVARQISTLLGAAVIGFTIWKLPTFPVRTQKFNWQYWVSILLLTAVITLLRLTLGNYWLQEPEVLVVALLSSGIAALVAATLLQKLKKRGHDI